MAEYLSPAVYIEEKKAGENVVSLPSSSTAAFIGKAEKGIANEPVLVGSWKEFTSKFGSFLNDSYLAYSVYGFFAEGGSRAYIVRVVPSDATKASVGLATPSLANPLFTIEAISEGKWGNDLDIIIEANDDYYDETNHTWTHYDISIVDSEGTLLEFYEALSLADPTDASYIVNVINNNSSIIRISSVGFSQNLPIFEGDLGENVNWATGDGTTTTFTGDTGFGYVIPNSIVLTVDNLVVYDDGNGNLIGDGTGTVEYSNTNSPGAISVTFNQAPANGSAIKLQLYYRRHLIAGEESFVPVKSVSFKTSGGSDGSALTRNDVSAPTLADDNKGIYALDKIDEMMTLVVPDFCTDNTVMVDLISYAESRKDIFVPLQVPAGYTPSEAVDFVKNTLNANTSYAAIYYPFVTITDPISGLPKNIPAVGHIAGIYARVDNTKNVGKAPAGITDGALRSIVGVERQLTKTERDLVFQAKINIIMDTPYTGKAVMGARTLSKESEWRYIQARRLFMYVEKALYQSSHWVLFENNNPVLWARITHQITSFLTTLHNNGYFAGTTPSESFYVICDDSVNTPDTIAQGWVIAEVGIAPNKPAEFYIIRLRQKTKK